MNISLKLAITIFIVQCVISTVSAKKVQADLSHNYDSQILKVNETEASGKSGNKNSKGKWHKSSLLGGRKGKGKGVKLTAEPMSLDDSFISNSKQINQMNNLLDEKPLETSTHKKKNKSTKAHTDSMALESSELSKNKLGMMGNFLNEKALEANASFLAELLEKASPSSPISKLAGFSPDFEDEEAEAEPAIIVNSENLPKKKAPQAKPVLELPVVRPISGAVASESHLNSKIPSEKKTPVKSHNPEVPENSVNTSSAMKSKLETMQKGMASLLEEFNVFKNMINEAENEKTASASHPSHFGHKAPALNKKKSTGTSAREL
ncbi:hypothetical protein NEAUS05_0588 [Nematocida ausubeli]|nr:hypothetical protein NEAUS07_0534 [Nematocida ausubeli]KAI5147274.1 hypothetical protein NEAUS05_0588 [Nematocida ausubeli]